jgi:hypothetical protein
MSAAEVEFQPGPAAALAGSGAIAIEAGGLRVRGVRPASVAPMVTGALVGVVGVIVAAIAIDALGIRIGTGRTFPLLVGMGTGIAPGWLVYRVLRERMRGQPIDLVVPWPAVRVVERSADRVVLRVAAVELRGDLNAVARDAASAELLATLPDDAT